VESPQFFVPGSPDDAEDAYRALAEFAGVEVPLPGERVFRIEFVHDGVRWTAEVGKQLHGDRILNPKSKQTWAEKVDDRVATVLAIFTGSPTLVVTDARPQGTAISKWVNPFMAGQPARVERFATAA
jgi:hypothetical protein